MNSIIGMVYHRILGIKYGYEGLVSKYNHPVVELTAPMVSNIHLIGGTFLGSSRGNQDVWKDG